LVRYWYNDDGDAPADGTVVVARVAGAVADRAGNTNLAGTASFVLDTHGPTGSLVAPAPGSTINQDSGHADIQWTDVGPAGLDTSSFGVGDIVLPGVDVDRIDNL